MEWFDIYEPINEIMDIVDKNNAEQPNAHCINRNIIFESHVQ